MRGDTRVASFLFQMQFRLNRPKLLEYLPVLSDGLPRDFFSKHKVGAAVSDAVAHLVRPPGLVESGK